MLRAIAQYSPALYRWTKLALWSGFSLVVHVGILLLTYLLIVRVELPPGPTLGFEDGAVGVELIDEIIAGSTDPEEGDADETVEAATSQPEAEVATPTPPTKLNRPRRPRPEPVAEAEPEPIQEGDDAPASEPDPGASEGGVDSAIARLIRQASGQEGSGAARSVLGGGECSDPVAGQWRARKYRSSDRTWVRFTLRIRRDGDQLNGEIISRIWSGRASQPNPPRCTAFGSDHTWHMPASGRITAGNRITFRASHVARTIEHCPRGGIRYAPDNFSGTITLGPPDVFSARNNDGAYDINEPYRFRRISCGD